jgi:DNA-binding winged helix-turn-helix (wHTH) protein
MMAEEQVQGETLHAGRIVLKTGPRILMVEGGHVVSYEDLIEDVLMRTEEDAGASHRDSHPQTSLRELLKRLRRKLRKEAIRLVTMPDVGLRLDRD